MGVSERRYHINHKRALLIGHDINWWLCDGGGPYVAVKEGQHFICKVLSTRSLEAKSAQFYRQGEPSRALVQTTRCNSNAAPLNAFTKTPPQNKNITYSGLKHCPDYKEALGESSKKKRSFYIAVRFAKCGYNKSEKLA